MGYGFFSSRQHQVVQMTDDTKVWFIIYGFLHRPFFHQLSLASSPSLLPPPPPPNTATRTTLTHSRDMFSLKTWTSRLLSRGRRPETRLEEFFNCDSNSTTQTNLERRKRFQAKQSLSRRSNEAYRTMPRNLHLMTQNGHILFIFPSVRKLSVLRS